MTEPRKHPTELDLERTPMDLLRHSTNLERELRGLHTILAALVARSGDGTARVVVTEQELSDVDLTKLRIVAEPLGGAVMVRYGDVEG